MVTGEGKDLSPGLVVHPHKTRHLFVCLFIYIKVYFIYNISVSGIQHGDSMFRAFRM